MNAFGKKLVYCMLAVLGPGIINWLGRWYWRIATGASEIWNVNASLLSHLKRRSWSPPASWPMYWQHQYEVWAAPGRAVRLAWVYWPLYKLAKVFRIRFVVNVVPGMGHNTVELDYFLRRLAIGEWPAGTRFALIRQPNDVHHDTVALYGARFWAASKSQWLYNLLLPLTMRYRDITIDCGLSRLKWQLRPDLSRDEPTNGQTFLYQISKEEVSEAWANYYRVRALTRNLSPLAEGIGVDPDLLSFLGNRTEKLALIHIKLHVANATAAPTNPENYVDALRYLQGQGYRLIFVGREPMPSVFRNLGALNYAESPVATYKHDLQIFSLASIAITAGSGIALIPDCMNIPLVYLDSWHIGMPLFSRNCVMVPALVRSRETGRLLTLAEQIKLYRSLPDRGDETFPNDYWEARNATADEIKAAIDEALTIAHAPSPLTDLQEKARSLESEGLFKLSEARISHDFLVRHEDLLSVSFADQSKWVT
jgi:putative glycosyltransferase (TIGR04372 family)